MTPLVAEAIANTIFAIAAILLLLIVSDFIAEMRHKREMRRMKEASKRSVLEIARKGGWLK